jgi:drug/metabolite transporter (DMT)-like permease
LCAALSVYTLLGMSAVSVGICFGLVASVAWAIANVYIQRSARAMGSLRSMFWGQLVGALLLAPCFAFWPLGADSVSLKWLLIGGASSAVAYYALFRAFGGGPVSTVSPIISGWAIVSCLLGVVVFSETIGPIRALGILLVVVGMASVASLSPTKAQPAGGTPHPASGWKEPRLQVLAWALASCVSFGVMVVSFRPLGRALGPVGTLLAVWGTQWLLLLPLLLLRLLPPLFRGRRGAILPPRAGRLGVWRLVFAVGFFEVVGFLGIEAGIRYAPIVVVSPVASTSAVVTVLIGHFWLDEEVPVASLLLTMVVVAGVMLVGLG